MSRTWKGRPVLVTGATGMIGAWLVKELIAREARVIAFILDADPQSELLRSRDIEKVSVIHGNLIHIEDIERAVVLHEVNTIFHLGAQTLVGSAHAAPRATFEANIRGTYNLLDVCRLHPHLVKRLLVASSDKAYGESPRLPYKEDMPLQGRYPYEVSKSCADLLAQSYFHTYRLPVAIARCGNVFGGGDLNWNRLVPGTIRSFLNSERPVLRSDGSFVRDYIYVKDAVKAYLDLADHLEDPAVKGEAFNFSDEQPLSVLQMVKAIQRAMSCEKIKPRIENTAAGEIHSQSLSSAKARKLLRWKPTYTLQEGLLETVAWYQNWLS